MTFYESDGEYQRRDEDMITGASGVAFLIGFVAYLYKTRNRSRLNSDQEQKQ